MIHVLCPNPAIDKLYAIDGFSAGEDYPGQRPAVRFGGKGVNVARVLSQLGEDVHLYAFVGEESEAGFAREMKPRCACTFVLTDGACRTTVNIIDRKRNQETVITECGPTVNEEQVKQMLLALESHVQPGDLVACSGSIIAGAPEDLYAQVSRLAERKGARCALDCNAGVLGASLKDAHYVLGKPNERELCALLGEERTQDPDKIAAYAGRLMPLYDMLLISMGGAGGMWVTKDAAYMASVPDVEVVSTVGSGDATLAGALRALSLGLAPDEALRLAMACGVANAMLGEVGSIRMQDVQAVRERIQVQKR